MIALLGVYKCGPTRPRANANASDVAWTLGQDIRDALVDGLAQPRLRLAGRKTHRYAHMQIMHAADPKWSHRSIWYDLDVFSKLKL